MSNIPMKPGYYWAQFRIPADGTHEAELWGFNDTWEIVQVNANVVDWYDDPAEDEALSVSVPGVRETQWRDGFYWGPFVAELDHRKPPPDVKARSPFAMTQEQRP